MFAFFFFVRGPNAFKKTEFLQQSVEEKTQQNAKMKQLKQERHDGGVELHERQTAMIAKQLSATNDFKSNELSKSTCNVCLLW